MKINQTKEDSTLTVALEGRLDTMTAPELESVLNDQLSAVTDLKFDFAQLEYISSAGLRVLLSAQKTMNRQGAMSISNVSEAIQEVFDITGFSDILTIC